MTRDGLSTYSVASAAQLDHARPTWPDGVLFHGSRLLLLFAVAAAITALFLPMRRSRLGQYQEGQVLSADVIAQVEFNDPKDPDVLEQEREEAARGMPPTFNFDREAGAAMAARLDSFFARLDSVALEGDPQMLRAHLLEESVTIDPGQADLLMEEATRRLLNFTAVDGVRRDAARGVVDAAGAGQLTGESVWVQDAVAEDARLVPSDQVLTGGDVQDQIVSDLGTARPELSEVLRLIIINHTPISLEYDPDATDSDRNARRLAVPISVGRVLVGEAIVRAAVRITAADLVRLQAHEEELLRLDLAEGGRLQFRLLVGQFLLNLSLLSVFGALLFFLRPMIYGSLRWLGLQSALVVIYFIMARIIASNEVLPHEALPIAFVVLTLAVLWDSRVALVMGLVLAGLTVAQPEFASTDTLFLVMIGAGAAALCVRVVRRRAQTWVFVAIITLAYAVMLLALFLVGERSAIDLGKSMLWAGGNAVFSAVIAMGFVPVFEWFTRITTDQTLLEWADPNAPLLRRLSLEAPGTYAHTINVANLAELAANRLEAHGLLCRVGLYYHDVGKVLKPHYFVENQHEGRNPHDKLKPDTSAAILIEHVVEGLRLGKEAKLPEVIQRFISEHHGTQLIAYFYDRAQEEHGEDNVDEAEYRYPGPKPQSKETAIAMMADSIESATRVLQEPTPERVRDLVNGIIEGKVKDGQLDDSPLTMREITTLKDIFVKVLSGIYHHRIDYPTTRHLTDAPDKGSEEQSEEASGDGDGEASRDGDGEASGEETVRESAEASGDGAGEGSRDEAGGASGEAAETGSEQMELGDDPPPFRSRS